MVEIIQVVIAALCVLVLVGVFYSSWRDGERFLMAADRDWYRRKAELAAMIRSKVEKEIANNAPAPLQEKIRQVRLPE